MVGYDPVISIGNYHTGNVSIEDCTFNFVCSNAYQTALDVSNSSNTTVTVNATDNKLNAEKAVAYTFDESKGETKVDTIQVASNIRNCCFFDFRYLSGKYSAVNEIGTVISGEVAVPSIK